MPSRAISVRPDPKPKGEGEIATETLVFRDFKGVNNQAARESINDDDFYWAENVQPVGYGNGLPIAGPTAAAIVTVGGETGQPSYTLPFNVNGTDYIFAVWSNSGNGWVGTAAGASWTKIFSGTLTSGKTAATQWNDAGLLVVDPSAGYYDWNVTTGATVTNLNGTLTLPPLNTGTYPFSTVGAGGLRVVDTGGSGTGGNVSASVTLTLTNGLAVGLSIVSGGTGYVVGDTVQMSGGTLQTSALAPAGQLSQPTTLSVSAVSSGVVTGLTVINGGYYAVGGWPGGTIATTGGTGTGLTLSVTKAGGWSFTSPFVTALGHGYVTPSVQYNVGSAGSPVWVTITPNAPFAVGSSGTLLGQAIAVYAGRVWVAIGRTVQFTDANSYNSFGNSGSSFTINDAWMHNQINALYAANNYLYIFGDDSIDGLSNVNVSATTGLATFLRANITASVGTNQPTSVFAHNRSILFSNASGFWSLSGATPQKLSDHIDTVVSAIVGGSTIYGVQVTINNILCAAFLIQFVDNITQAGVTRSLLCVWQRGEWWFLSQNGMTIGGVVSIPVATSMTLSFWSGNALYGAISAGQSQGWLLKTKLWDAGSPIQDKQILQIGMDVIATGTATTPISGTVDNEYQSFATTINGVWPTMIWINSSHQVVTWVNNSNLVLIWLKRGFAFLSSPGNAGSGRYFGLTLSGFGNVAQILSALVNFKKMGRWLSR